MTGMHERRSHQKPALRLEFERYYRNALPDDGRSQITRNGLVERWSAGIEPRPPACKFCSGRVRRGQRMSRGHGFAVCDSAVYPRWATMVSLI